MDAAGFRRPVTQIPARGGDTGGHGGVTLVRREPIVGFCPRRGRSGSSVSGYGGFLSSPPTLPEIHLLETPLP